MNQFFLLKINFTDYKKLDEWNTIIKDDLSSQVWLDSSSSGSEDEDESDDDDDDEDDDEDDNSNNMDVDDK